ncbi:MAG: tetratricopeptide repeat protein [Spirochaetales bacterium]|nr:tetratricopeptide repeat protein [Spirochaetales bacterium]
MQIATNKIKNTFILITTVCLFIFFFSCSQENMELLKANRLASSVQLEPRLQAYEIYLRYASVSPQAREGLLSVCKSIGISYTINREFREGIRYLSQAIEMDPTQYIAHYYIGVCYANLWSTEMNTELKEDYKKKAVAHYQRAIEIVPTLTSAHYGLGFFYFEAFNDYKKAKDELLEVLRLEPKNVRAHFVLAQIAYLEGDLALARDYYVKILSLISKKDPRRQTVLDNIAQIDRELGNK